MSDNNATTDESPSKFLEIDVDKIPSPVLRRLIEEVRNDEQEHHVCYNRFHNRHNRSR